MQPVLLQIQTDVTGRLTVELASWGITVRSRRQLIVDNEVDEAQLVLTNTTGKSGCGCLVHMPTFVNERPNVPGPLGYLEITVSVWELPEINLNASTGTLRSAEEVAARVLQLFQLFAVQTCGTFMGGTLRKGSAPEQGILAYDVALRINYAHDVLAKTATPTVTSASGTVTITASEGTAYYTTDGESYPGSEMPNTYTYSAPFTATVGSVVRVGAYAASKTGSNIVEHTVA